MDRRPNLANKYSSISFPARKRAHGSRRDVTEITKRLLFSLLYSHVVVYEDGARGRFSGAEILKSSPSTETFLRTILAEDCIVFPHSDYAFFHMMKPPRYICICIRVFRPSVIHMCNVDSTRVGIYVSRWGRDIY